MRRRAAGMTSHFTSAEPGTMLLVGSAPTSPVRHRTFLVNIAINGLIAAYSFALRHSIVLIIHKTPLQEVVI